MPPATLMPPSCDTAPGLRPTGPYEISVGSDGVRDIQPRSCPCPYRRMRPWCHTETAAAEIRCCRAGTLAADCIDEVLLASASGSPPAHWRSCRDRANRFGSCSARKLKRESCSVQKLRDYHRSRQTAEDREESRGRMGCAHSSRPGG